MRLLQEIQDEIVSDNHAFFPEKAYDLGHHVMSLCGEVGEGANVVKKMQRGSYDPDDEEVQLELASELVDVFIYVLSCAGIIGMNMEEFYAAKREFNATRFKGTI